MGVGDGHGGRGRPREAIDERNTAAAGAPSGECQPEPSSR
jgi:hypothetical protein